MAKHARQYERSLAQSADQVGQIAAGDPMDARPIAIRMSDSNDPALLAEFDCRINRRLEPDTIVHACHCCRSPELSTRQS